MPSLKLALALTAVVLTTGACGGTDDSPDPTVAAPASAAASQPAADGAATAVEELYAAAKAADGSGLQALEDAATPELAAALRGAGEGVIESDPVYDAQDSDVQTVEVGEPQVSGSTATVVASFTNLSTPTTVTYELQAVGGEWLVSDVRYADGRTLTDVLKG